MKIIYTFENDKVEGESLFLAGPTPRSADVQSWRPKTIELLENKFKFDGTVYCPEYREGHCDIEGKGKFNDQIDWEHNALDTCDAILMWVPRKLETMPALTTNIEFGFYVKSGRLFYGRPPESVKNHYLDYCYMKFTGRKFESTLEGLIDRVLKSFHK